MTNNKVYQFYCSIIVVSAMFFVASCTGLGKQVRFLPMTNEKWQNDPGNYLRDNSVIYRCKDLVVEVQEIPLRGRLYTTGIILPIIPLPIGYDRDEVTTSLEIDLAIKSDNVNIEIKQEDLSIGFNGKNYKPIRVDSVNSTKKQRIQHEVYKYYFDIPKTATNYFELHFNDMANGCEIPSVNFKFDEKISIGVAAQ